MKGAAALRDRAVAEADVLAWLRADYRLRSGVDPEVDGTATLTATTTIQEWRDACDLVRTRCLARAMNQWFGCDRPVKEWYEVLEPERTRTLGDLAKYAAPFMRLADFAPVIVAGQAHAASGAFFALCHLLGQEADGTADIRPRTRIASLAAHEVVALGAALAKFAPDLTPKPVVVPKLRQQAGMIGAAVGFVLAMIGMAAELPALAWTSGGGILVGIVLARGRPERVDFGSFTTVADVARAVARDREAAA